MFKCKECGSNEFQLMVHPEYRDSVEIGCNEHDEVVITMNGQQFVADLMFMNRFAVCRECDAIRSWEYFFPNKLKAM